MGIRNYEDTSMVLISHLRKDVYKTNRSAIVHHFKQFSVISVFVSPGYVVLTSILHALINAGLKLFSQPLFNFSA